MEIVELSHNDSLVSAIRKCNANFKQITWLISNLVKKQSRTDMGHTEEMINDIHDDITRLVNVTIPDEVSSQISQADIPQQISDAIDVALPIEMTNTLSDFFAEDGCTVTACNAMRWGNMAFIRFSYRLNSALTVPSNGDFPDVTLGTLKIGWRPFDMTNVILDQTHIIIGDVGSNGVVQARSANSRGTSYTIDANSILYASMTLMIGLQ